MYNLLYHSLTRYGVKYLTFLSKLHIVLDYDSILVLTRDNGPKLRILVGIVWRFSTPVAYDNLGLVILSGCP